MDAPLFPDLSHDDHSPDAWVGEDVSLPWVLAAYPRGFFPWPVEGEEDVLWWCPRERMVFEMGGLHLSRSLRRTVRRGRYRVSLDRDFAGVLARCRDQRGPGRDGTWITPEIRAVYEELHDLGYGHSVEAWAGERLVGGVYGLSLGGTFFGESMFADEPDASKVALATLMAQLERWDFDLFDCQVPNEHLVSLGGTSLRRSLFLQRLRRSLGRSTRRGRWELDADLAAGPPEAFERGEG